MHMLRMLGISLTSTCTTDLHERSSTTSSVRGFKFATSDLQETQVRLKYMNLMDYALAKMYAAQAESIRQAQSRVSQSQGMNQFQPKHNTIQFA